MTKITRANQKQVLRGRELELISGALVWMARLPETEPRDGFSVRFESEEGNVTAFHLSMEAMQAFVDLQGVLRAEQRPKGPVLSGDEVPDEPV